MNGRILVGLSSLFLVSIFLADVGAAPSLPPSAPTPAVDWSRTPPPMPISPISPAGAPSFAPVPGVAGAAAEAGSIISSGFSYACAVNKVIVPTSDLSLTCGGDSVTVSAGAGFVISAHCGGLAPKVIIVNGSAETVKYALAITTSAFLTNGNIEVSASRAESGGCIAGPTGISMGR